LTLGKAGAWGAAAYVGTSASETPIRLANAATRPSKMESQRTGPAGPWTRLVRRTLQMR
jgi:hypothetical protein